MEDQSKFEGFAKVEVMGHVVHFGHVTTVYFGTAGFFRVDVPTIPAREEITQSDRWRDGHDHVPAGSKIQHPEITGYTTLVGCGSIYQMTPCDRDTVIAAIVSSVRRPWTILELAKTKQLAPVYEDEEEDEDDEDEAIEFDLPPVDDVTGCVVSTGYNAGAPDDQPFSGLGGPVSPSRC